MLRHLALLLTVAALLFSIAGCGPITVVLPGATVPTAAPTGTAVPATVLPSAATPTITPIVVTATPTPVPPTATSAPVPPTATPTTAPPAPTNTPIPPTSVVPKPDLYISEMSVDPASPRMGQAVTVRVGVYNQGNAAAGAFKVEWWAASAAKGCDWDVTSLVAHGGRILSCTYTYGGWANYTVRAVADPTGMVAESDESNNTKSMSVQVLPPLASKPNLIISDLKVNPASPTQGSPATFSATVYNSGDAAAPASHVEIWAASAAKACTKAVPALVAHGGVVISCTYTYGGWSNAYAVKAIADSDSEVDESNESDNTKQITISVKPM